MISFQDVDKVIEQNCTYHYKEENSAFDLNANVNNELYFAYCKGVKDAFNFIMPQLCKEAMEDAEESKARMNEFAQLVMSNLTNEQLVSKMYGTKQETKD